jgi:hypothetical protein
VWFLELAARTVCQGEGLLPAAEQAVDVSENGPPSASALTQLVAPRFVALSLLHKLLAAGRVPRWLLNQGQYKLWPGLPQLLADPGAEWLRTLTLGELARVLAGDHAGIVQAAAIRFIAAVLEVPEPALQIWGRLFLAQLFWETLDLDRELLGRLFQQPRLSATLRAALAAVEQPVEPFAEFPDACHQLVETRILLHTIDQYDALTALATAAGKPRRPTPAPALTL